MPEKNKPKLSTEDQMKLLFPYTDNEMGVIRNTFFAKETMLALRKSLWQIPMSKTEAKLVILKKEAINILRKSFIPTLSSMESLEEMKDVWLLDFENMTPQYAVLLFKVRKLVINYFEQRFAELEGNISLNKIEFAKLSEFENKTDENAYIEMSARNMIARETQRVLWLLHTLAVPKETEEEKANRLAKDSTK